MKKPAPQEPAWRFRRSESKGLDRWTFRAGSVEFHCGWSTKKFPLRVSSTQEFAEFCEDLERNDRREGEGSLRRFFLHPRERFAFGIQTHSANAAVMDDEAASRGRFLRFEDTDALATALPDVRLGVFSADCLTLLMGSSEGPMPVAAVHAGWRGTAAGVAEAAAARLRELGGDPGKAFVLMGPALRACCYEVGPEFREKFPSSVSERDGVLRFDIAAENKRRLAAAGFRPADIFDSGLCTGCDAAAFYSWRREKDEAKRLVSWIVKASK